MSPFCTLKELVPGCKFDLAKEPIKKRVKSGHGHVRDTERESRCFSEDPNVAKRTGRADASAPGAGSGLGSPDEAPGWFPPPERARPSPQGGGEEGAPGRGAGERKGRRAARRAGSRGACGFLPGVPLPAGSRRRAGLGLAGFLCPSDRRCVTAEGQRQAGTSQSTQCVAFGAPGEGTADRHRSALGCGSSPRPSERRRPDS